VSLCISKVYLLHTFLLCLCPVADNSATVSPVGMKFCMILHISPGQVFSLFLEQCPKGILQIRNFGPKFWPFDSEYLESGKSQHSVSSRA